MCFVTVRSRIRQNSGLRDGKLPMNPYQGVTTAILAGGLGTRLRSVIADRPKVLASIAGQPFLARLLDQLVRIEMKEAVLLVGFGAEQVRSAFGDRYNGLRLTYSAERSPLGTAGAVRLALPLLSSDIVMLMNGDSCCDLDFRAFQEFHCRHGHGVSVALVWVDNASRYGSVQLDESDRLVKFEEKSQDCKPGWINAGIYMIQRSLIDTIVPDRPASLERDFLPAQVAAANVYGFRCQGKFIDIGTPESYAVAEAFFAMS
jgi:D-glycero-alpha-D-manno-heptose 1-phosphate guanylyltransferase